MKESVVNRSSVQRPITVLDSIPFKPDLLSLQEALRIKPGSTRSEEFLEFVKQAQKFARPKAIYKIAFVEEKGDAHVIVDGIRLDSRVLRVNLENAHRVFPYIITCGMELEIWQEELDDFLHRFWVDAIKESALEAGFKAFEDHLNSNYKPGPLSGMNPGSLEDWPLPQQHELFSLLSEDNNPAGVEMMIGVQLTDSFLMLPNKTVSGILFPTETSFASCQLCPREICPNRRAPYDASLYAEKYLAENFQPTPLEVKDG